MVSQSSPSCSAKVQQRSTHICSANSVVRTNKAILRTADRRHSLVPAGAARYRAIVCVIAIPIDHCYIRKVGLGQLLRCRDSTDATADNDNSGRCHHLRSQGLKQERLGCCMNLLAGCCMNLLDVMIASTHHMT